MSGTREENVFMARLAEQAERYEDMIHYMTSVAKMGAELNLEERNLLSVAFKNAVGARRQAWRQVTAMMQKEAQEAPVPQCVHDYKTSIEAELKQKCNEILTLLSQGATGLIASSTNEEGQVFYRKMEGDYWRYLAEFSEGSERDSNARNAYTAYDNASQVAKSALPSTHPIRLGLALNFSVFYFEVYQQADHACKLARESFDAALADMQSGGVNEDQLKDSHAILQLLRDNLQLWESSQSGDGRPPEQDGTVCEDM